MFILLSPDKVLDSAVQVALRNYRLSSSGVLSKQNAHNYLEKPPDAPRLPLTCLCEAGFPSFSSTKMISPNRWGLEADRATAVFSFRPDMKKNCKR